jgi:transcriptional regulator with XRE-family HTH domain
MTKVKLKADAIYDHQRRTGCTQRQLADELGISTGYFSLLLSGKRSPSPKLCKRMVEVLGKTHEKLFDVLTHSAPSGCLEGASAVG